MTEKDIIDFVDTFVFANTYEEVASAYETFRKNSVLEKINYEQFISRLEGKRKNWKENSEKQLKDYVLELLSNMKKILIKGYPENDVNVRQKLINIMGEKVSQAVQINDQDGKMISEPGIKYFGLHLIIDMLFVYCDDFYSIMALAMLYDLMCDWNKTAVEEFRRYYGTEGEEEIIVYTYRDVELISGARGIVPEQWLKYIEGKLNKQYVIDFYKKLLSNNSIEQNNFDEHTMKTARLKLLNKKSSKWLHKKATEKKEELVRQDKYRGGIRRIICWTIYIIIIAVLIGFCIVMGIKTAETNRDIEELKQINEAIQKQKDELLQKNEELQEDNSDLQEKLDDLKKQEENVFSGLAEDEQKSSNSAGDFIMGSGETERQEEDAGNDYSVGDIYVITQDNQRVRISKSTENERNVIGVLARGDSVEVAEIMDRDGWLGILFNNQKAYIKLEINE